MYDAMSSLSDVNTVSDLWTKTFVTAVENVFDKRLCRDNGKQFIPWIDQECIDLRDQLLNQCDNTEKETLGKRYKSLRQKKKRQFKIQKMNELENACGNSKIFWEIIKGLPSASENTDVKIDPSEICKNLSSLSQIPVQEYFDTDFEKYIESILDNHVTLDVEHDKCFLDIINANITVEEI